MKPKCFICHYPAERIFTQCLTKDGKVSQMSVYLCGVCVDTYRPIFNEIKRRPVITK